MLIYHLKGKPTHTLATDGSNDSDLTKRNPLTTEIFDISLNKVTSKMCTTKIECYCHRYLWGGGNVITQNQIPWDKCVAFSVDNASVNMGKRKQKLN